MESKKGRTDNTPEDAVLAVEELCWLGRDEELAAVRGRGEEHGQDTCGVSSRQEKEGSNPFVPGPELAYMIRIK